MITDSLIVGREAMLNGLLGVSGFVLNGVIVDRRPVRRQNLPGALQRVMERLALEAFADRGYRVDYGRVKRSGGYRFYRKELAPRLRQFDPASLTQGGERLAFWINLYNLLIIDAVLTLEVKTSITEGWLGVLAFVRRAAYNIGGFRISCEDIEQGILRSNRGHPYMPGPHFRSNDERCSFVLHPFEPRIHFALNCASRSCPPLRVYSSAQIDRQLDEAAQGFLANHVRIDIQEGELHVSSIFNWFKQDFGHKRAVIDLILRYLPATPERNWLANNRESVRVLYQPYDWRLNTVAQEKVIHPP